MKISLAWLNEYLDRPVDADEIERLLTQQGTPIETREAIANNDTVVDVEVTSNRSDCLSHVGVAREVAAGSSRTLRLPDAGAPAPSGDAVEKLTSVTVETPALCPVYTARVIRGVKVGPSPAWLVRKLEAVGLKSVSNVVDVTNFILFEMGQPLHAFDLNALDGKRIVVRHAKPGEMFEAIDHTTHELGKPGQDVFVIADAKKPVAIAGVMGGVTSEVTASTTDVLLESALFEPLAVRRSARALRLASDSSYRFERGVDPRGVELASRRAAALIIQLAGGTLAPGVIRVGAPEPAEIAVTMRLRRCADLLGYPVSVDRAMEILSKLGFRPVGKERSRVLQCTVPSHRLDVSREIDLIEEVARLNGLSNVPVRDRLPVVTRGVQVAVEARRRLAQTLVAHGYHEAITFSFVKPSLGEPFLAPGARAVLIDDERRKAEPMLRPSVLPSLLVSRKFNQDAGNQGVRLFETASVWTREDGAIVERRKLALIADATASGGDAIRSLRGTVEETIAALAGHGDIQITPTQAPAFAAAASVAVNGKAIGVLGLLSPQVQKLFELLQPLVAAEFDLEALLALYPPKRSIGALPRFPAIERDLSIVVDEGVAWDKVRACVKDAQPAHLEELQFLVAYRGKPIPQGKKSVSLRMLFRDPASTLRHEQADEQVARVVSKLKADVNAELRA